MVSTDVQTFRATSDRTVLVAVPFCHFCNFLHHHKDQKEQRIRKQLPQATMDHIEAQLKKIRTKLDDVPAFQKAEVSVPFYLLPRPFGSLMMTELWPKIVRSWEGWPAAPCWGVIP